MEQKNQLNITLSSDSDIILDNIYQKLSVFNDFKLKKRSAERFIPFDFSETDLYILHTNKVSNGALSKKIYSLKTSGFSGPIIYCATTNDIYTASFAMKSGAHQIITLQEIDPQKVYEVIIDTWNTFLQEADTVQKHENKGNNDKLYKISFENALDAMLWVNTETGVILNCNKAAEKLFESNKDTLIGKKHSSIYPENTVFNSLIKGKEFIENDAEIITAKGNKKNVLITSTLNTVNNERLLFSIIHDITDKKQAEKRLINKNKTILKYKDALYELISLLHSESSNILNEIIYIVTQLMPVNEAGIWIKLNDGNTFKCQSFYDAINDAYNNTQDKKLPISEPNIEKMARKSILSGTNNSFFNLYPLNSEQNTGIDVPVWKDGKFIGFLRLVLRKLKTQISDLEIKLLLEVSNILTTYYEIEERKYSKKALSLKEQQYKLLFDNMLDGLAIFELILDENGLPVDARYVDVNKSFEELIGIKKEQLIGKTETEYFNTLDPVLFKNIYSVVNEGKPKRFEYTLKKQKRNIEILAYKSNQNQFVTVLHDITDKKRYIENLKNTTFELKELNSTKDKFFSIIAHDLKNPFNFLSGFSSLLLKSAEKLDKEKIVKYAGIINEASQQGFSLLENLLEWSRAQTGRIKINPNNINLKTTVIDVIALFESLFLKKSIKVHLNIAEDIFVFVDKYMLMTVLRNLISNAIKFTEPNGDITIRSLQKDSNYVTVQIIDNGTGISKEDIEKLFRIDVNPSRIGTSEEKGTGLGLILCKEFVLKNNGEIWVESEEGKGSSFSFTIPSTNDKK